MQFIHCFNTLIITGSGEGPHLYGMGTSFVASINGTVSANFFAGDGWNLFNLNGAIIDNVTAIAVSDNSFTSIFIGFFSKKTT